MELGSYRIDRELGVGGMGTVYAAHGPEGVVALKVVHPHLLDGGDAAERFRREVEIGMTVAHENVVRTFDRGEVDGRHYLAMEYVEGQTLAALREELDRVPEELCRHIGREVCRGLGAIHAAGAVHRDVKPDNVLVTPDHVVKIMDLGVACTTDDALRLSQTGAFVGSLQYAAPEQFLGGGKDLDGRVDLHALGLVLYELATGVSPYVADDVARTMHKVLHETPRRLGDLNPQFSAFFEEVVHCLLAKERDERFADAAELLAVLEAGEDAPWWRARAAALQRDTARPIRRVRIPRETAVYGRETELATLRALFQRAKAGDGNVVLIEGEAGIGKSRLVDELVGQLQRDGEEIDFLYGSYPPGGAATVEGAFSTAYREQFGAAGSAAYLPDNQVLVPAFDALLRGDTTPPDAEPLTKASLQTCFVRATQALSAERVVVVLIDDLHFAPEEGRALFTSLALGLPGHRVLLVGTARPGVSEEWQAGLTRLDQATRVALSRLGPKDLVRLLEDTLKSERLAHDLSAQIATKSDGNPFFVFEIIRGLREGQFITQADDGTWVSTRVIEDIQIPDTLVDLIQARIADLSEEEKELLDVASCCGFEFDPRLVAEVVGLGRIPALRLLGGIEKSHRLVRSAGRAFAFDHHQVQESLYAGISGALREEYHAAIADALERREDAAGKDAEALPGALCVALCEHSLGGARGAQALRYLPAAQSHLEAGYLHAQVAALTESALAVPGLLEGVDRARTLVRLAGALDLLGRRDAQEACAREAERLAAEAGDEEWRGQALLALATCLYRVARWDEGAAAAQRALEVARARGDTKGEADASRGLGNILLDLGRFPEAFAQQERTLELSRAIGDRAGEAGATVNAGLVRFHQARYDEAEERFERGAALSREIGHRRFEAAAMGNLANCRSYRGRAEDAERNYERTRALAEEIGDRQSASFSMGNLANVLTNQGRFAEAKELYERAIAISREIGDVRHEATALYNLSLVLHDEGDEAGADALMRRALELSESIRYAVGIALAKCSIGSLRAARSRDAGGDGAPGRAALEEARDLAVEIGIPGVETLARCELALLRDGDAIENGAVEDALAAYEKHGERFKPVQHREARFLLYRATGDRAHLDAAKHLVDEALANAPEQYHDAMREKVRTNREILAAWNARDA